MDRMDDKHLEVAKKIADKHRKRKRCDNCYDRGYIGTTTENMLMLCHKCVDMEAAVEEWNEYVETQPDLKEHFAKIDKPEEVEGEDKRPIPKPKQNKHLHERPERPPVIHGHKSGDR